MRQLLFVLFLLASLPAASASAGSVAQLDQSADYIGGLASTVAAAQTFTVGKQGVLDRVEVPIRIWQTPGTILEYYLQVLWTEDNDGILTHINARRVGLKYFNAQPSDAVFDGNFIVGGFHWVSLDNLAIPVNVGDQLAITVSIDNPPGGILNYIDWGGGSPYAGGKPWALDEQGRFHRKADFGDFAFRTFVVPVPEPAAALLTGVALLSLAALRRRK